MKFYNRNVLETAAQASAFARMRKSEEIFRSVAYYHQNASDSQVSVAQTAAELFQQTNTTQVLTSAAQVVAQRAEQFQQKRLSITEISSMASTSALVTVARSLELLSEKDFRISVASQDINHELESNPEGVLDTLLFKEVPEPSNEFESQFFDLLKQQRKVLNDHTEILKEINQSKAHNVPDKPSDEKHSSPAFYKDKMWSLEQIASGIIGAIIGDIISATIGADKSNMIAFVLLLGCLLHFIKTK